MKKSFQEMRGKDQGARIAAAELVEQAELKAEEVKLLAEKVAKNLIMQALELRLDKLDERIVILEIKIKDK
jgi:hypothetical protein